MQIRAPEGPREARHLRRPPLESGAPKCRRLRAAERAVWPVGRPVLTRGLTDPIGVLTHEQP
eukprot:14236646-Alexandrium_andersonii.AAC.1